jgi:hypothetical protein
MKSPASFPRLSTCVAGRGWLDANAAPAHSHTDIHTRFGLIGTTLTSDLELGLP